MNRTIKDIREERGQLFRDDPENGHQLPLIVEEIRARVKNAKRQIFEIGRLLTEAKDLVGHGNFKDWIKSQEFDFSYQTANNFMNVYRYCLERPQLAQSIRASILYKITSPNFPKDLRKHLFKHANALANISNATIKDICQRFRDGELDLDSPEIERLIQYRHEHDQYLRYKAELEDAIGMLENLGKTISKVGAGITWPIFPGEEQTVLTAEQAQKVGDLIAILFTLH